VIFGADHGINAAAAHECTAPGQQKQKKRLSAVAQYLNAFK